MLYKFMNDTDINKCKIQRVCIPEIPEIDDREAYVTLDDESFVEMIGVERVQRRRNAAHRATQTTLLWRNASETSHHASVITDADDSHASIAMIHLCDSVIPVMLTRT